MIGVPDSMTVNWLFPEEKAAVYGLSNGA